MAVMECTARKTEMGSHRAALTVLRARFDSRQGVGLELRAA